VITSLDSLGDVIGDLNRRRGVVHGNTVRGTSAVVQATVPLKEMFGYIGRLRTLTSGRGQYAMHLDHYEAVPARELAAIAN
jgi:elongation factor G